MKTALIVSHGQPSDPEPAETALADLAARVGSHLPDWQVVSATLAAPGALARAVGGRAGVVFPLFMSGGWFTRIHLPKRLAEAGGDGDWQLLEPLGCDPAVAELAIDMLRAEGPVESVILAAHGSGKSPAPSAIANKLALRIRSELGLRVDAAFIEQEPRIAAARGHGPGSVCLPFFAAEGGHVSDDLPAALEEAGFAGRLLPALGLHPRLPQVIARAIAAGRPICAGECRAALG